MKKLILSLVAIATLSLISFGQAPEGFKYQAVVRDAGNTILNNQAVGIRMTIQQGSIGGTTVYQETFAPTTNAYGLVNLEIGSGSVVSGTFATIDWANGPYFIETAVDVTGGTSYAVMGTSQLMSVPYALYAKTSGNGQGPAGPQGNQGPAGVDGTNGTNGIDGAIGTAGPQGIQGPAGVDGTNGPTGLTGPQGIQGLSGIQGPSGATGPQGSIGLTGYTGPPGAAGPAGTEGIQGPQGLLSSGSAAGNTSYWDGSQWVVNGSNFYNNGSNLGVGTTAPNNSAITEMNSTTQGFLPPRMTSTQRDAIQNPAIGLIIFNLTSGCPNYYSNNQWFEWCGTGVTPVAILSALNCGSTAVTGTLNSGIAASGVLASVPYTGGNGGAFVAESISSTGVTGLTASLTAGLLSIGNGTLSLTISGTPATSGTASFALTIGGQSCTFTDTVVVNLVLAYPANSVFCASGPTAIVDVTNPTTGKIWMDRNLGAAQAATSSTDAASYGDLYQWGRRADGHQCRNSATTTILSSTDQPGNANFILAPFAPSDWRSTQNVNLWQGVNGVNNPCPSGYRIPTETEINAERLSWGQNTIAGAFDSPLKLPVAGYRSGSSGFIDAGTGFYWSSSVFGGTDSRGLLIEYGNAYLFVGSRSFGYSVRCLKD